MMIQIVETEIRESLNQLPLELQRKVLEFARSLVSAQVHGAPGKNLLRFAGAINKEDLETMKEAVEKNCEKIDFNEW